MREAKLLDTVATQAFLTLAVAGPETVGFKGVQGLGSLLLCRGPRAKPVRAQGSEELEWFSNVGSLLRSTKTVL